MKRILLLIICATVMVGCGPSNTEIANALRKTAACNELLNEIESRSDVVKAIITDNCGLSVSLGLSDNKPEILANYFLRMAKSKGVKVEFCKIVSAHDYKWGKWFMLGTKLAFVSAGDVDYTFVSVTPPKTDSGKAPDMFSEYQKYFPVVTDGITPKFSINEIITTKDINLGCIFDSILTINGEATETIRKVFNTYCAMGYILLLPPKTKLKVIKVNHKPNHEVDKLSIPVNYDAVKVLVENGEFKGKELYVSIYIRK